MPDLVLYQPETPGNTGTLLRLAACLDFTLHIVEPASFRLDEKALRRAGMDYLEQASLKNHLDWEQFENWRKERRRRLILFTTSAHLSYTEFNFHHSDLLMLGRETSGVPEHVHEVANASVIIPMKKGTRSINLALSGAMAMGEALRQTV